MPKSFLLKKILDGVKLWIDAKGRATGGSSELLPEGGAQGRIKGRPGPGTNLDAQAAQGNRAQGGSGALGEGQGKAVKVPASKRPRVRGSAPGETGVQMQDNDIPDDQPDDDAFLLTTEEDALAELLSKLSHGDFARLLNTGGAPPPRRPDWNTEPPRRLKGWGWMKGCEGSAEVFPEIKFRYHLLARVKHRKPFRTLQPSKPFRIFHRLFLDAGV